MQLLLRQMFFMIIAILAVAATSVVQYARHYLQVLLAACLLLVIFAAGGEVYTHATPGGNAPGASVGAVGEAAGACSSPLAFTKFTLQQRQRLHLQQLVTVVVAMHLVRARPPTLSHSCTQFAVVQMQHPLPLVYTHSPAAASAEAGGQAGAQGECSPPPLSVHSLCCSSRCVSCRQGECAR